jgi:predicted DNA-binding antitoxin AbrB/MazE fold protein
MITVKGVYENGEIKLLEAAPVKAGNKVLVTFIEEEEDTVRNISFQQQSPAFKNYLEDNDEDLYQDYIKQ